MIVFKIFSKKSLEFSKKSWYFKKQGWKQVDFKILSAIGGRKGFLLRPIVFDENWLNFLKFNFNQKSSEQITITVICDFELSHQKMQSCKVFLEAKGSVY